MQHFPKLMFDGVFDFHMNFTREKKVEVDSLDKAVKDMIFILSQDPTSLSF